MAEQGRQRLRLDVLRHNGDTRAHAIRESAYRDLWVRLRAQSHSSNMSLSLHAREVHSVHEVTRMLINSLSLTLSRASTLDADDISVNTRGPFYDTRLSRKYDVTACAKWSCIALCICISKRLCEYTFTSGISNLPSARSWMGQGCRTTLQVSNVLLRTRA